MERQDRIENVSDKIRTLERRLGALKTRLTSRIGSVGSMSYDRAEASALEAAIGALKLHWREVHDIPRARGIIEGLLDRKPGAETAAREYLGDLG